MKSIIKDVVIKTKNEEKDNKGITLVALVITVIILLILAGITIADLTGEKGLIKEAKTAKELTELAGLEEQIDLAIIKAEQKHRNPTIDDVIAEIKNNKVISDESKVDKETGAIHTVAGYLIEGKLDDYIGKTSTGDGDNTGGGDTPTPPAVQKSQLEEAKETGNVLNETDNTTITDGYGNQVIVPPGFKIGSESATDVTGGVVIEDVSHTATAGSEFVWVPVGKVYTDVNQTEANAKTITLGRYVFNDDGSINEELSKTEPSDQLKESSTASYYFTEGLKDDTTTNVHAKDIATFRTKANSNHGYYIGRYEARTVESAGRTSASKDNGAGVTVKKDGYVYNNVTQPESARLSQHMYSDSNFTSDLVNSYAWDTAIVFLQTFDNRANKTEETKPYSMQNSLNTGSLANQGTNNLLDTTKHDKICNIWDMASNTWEWTTETYGGPSLPCTGRGGRYSYSGFYTDYRGRSTTTASYDNSAFRVLLYL